MEGQKEKEFKQKEKQTAVGLVGEFKQFKWNLCDDFYWNKFPFSLNVFVQLLISRYSLPQNLLLAGAGVIGDHFLTNSLFCWG